VANIFCQQLRRLTSLNHLAQSSRSVLRHAEQVDAMERDWGKVDIDAIIDQAQWVCHCDERYIKMRTFIIERYLKQLL
jgi:hypothetical protein